MGWGAERALGSAFAAGISTRRGSARLGSGSCGSWSVLSLEFVLCPSECRG